MLDVLTKGIGVDTRHLTAGLRRQILLSNLLALVGVCTTALYQLFFIFWNPSVYLPAIGLNCLFMLNYLATLWFNRAGLFTTARNVVLGNAVVQIAVATYLIGAGTGVQLFYFALAGLLALTFYHYRSRFLFVLGAVILLLFLLCELAFTESRLPLPHLAQQIMYIGNTIGSMALVAAFAYVFRVEIEEVQRELLASNRSLEKLSTTDGLTGLANRRGMDEFLERARARMRREHGCLSILMCDVDYFKPYNDCYGHQAGDLVLQRVASVLEDAARRPSDLASRYGGEEFVLILPHTDASDSQLVGQRILASVAALAIRHERSEATSTVTVSIGISTATKEMQVTGEQILSAADKALYRAKRSGRNRIAFEPPVTSPFCTDSTPLSLE